MACNKIFIVFLAFVLHFTAFTNAYASTSNSIGGWSIVNTVQQGASTVFNLSKNAVINGANVAKTSTAKITPAVGQVAKAIKVTGAVLAVDLAIKALIGSVDYVMDPANNRVIYHLPSDNGLYQSHNFCSGVNVTFSSEQQANNYICNNADCNTRPSQTAVIVSSTMIQCNPAGFFMPRAGVVAQPTYTEKTIPYSQVAQEIIDGANNGDQVRGGYVGGVAQDLVNNGQAVGVGGTSGGQSTSDSAAAQQSVKDQAEANAKTETQDASSNSQAKPNDAGGYDITLEFPAFCGWAPLVCQAAQIVISFPSLVTGWWNTVSDWLSNTREWWNTGKNAVTSAWQQVKDWVQDATDYFKNEPETNTELDLDVPIPVDIDTSINFGGQCPSPIVHSFSWHGTSQEFGITDWTPFCSMLNDIIKPVVIAIASFVAVLIIGGVRTNDE